MHMIRACDTATNAERRIFVSDVDTLFVGRPGDEGCGMLTGRSASWWPSARVRSKFDMVCAIRGEGGSWSLFDVKDRPGVVLDVVWLYK